MILALWLMYRQNLKLHPMSNNMAGNLVTSIISRVSDQLYLKDSVFWLVQMMLYVMV